MGCKIPSYMKINGNSSSFILLAYYWQIYSYRDSFRNGTVQYRTVQAIPYCASWGTELYSLRLEKKVTLSYSG